MGATVFSGFKECPDSADRAGQTVVASLDGGLLRSRNPFPYYMLVALEAGSPLRALLLLLLAPIVWLAWDLLLNESIAIQIMVFVSTAGLKLSDVVGVSRAVLPKFYLEDVSSQAHHLLMSCGGKRYVLTSSPTVMVEYCLKAHVGVHQVFGTELQVTGSGYCTGLVSSAGVLLGKAKEETVRKLFRDGDGDGDTSAPQLLGLGGSDSDRAFLSLCKEGYMRRQDVEEVAVAREKYWKLLVFHDGRLVARPTPMVSLTVFLWAPFGLALALARIMVALCLPMEVGFACGALLGVGFRVKGAPPLPVAADEGGQGILFACTHRSLIDPTFLSMALRRKVRALVYSVSRVSELIAPIRTACLTRDRQEDARLIGRLLQEEGEDLVVCPEGTTCREPYLLRFSSLFAELTEHVVPVAMRVRMSMFHGTSARGYKSLDAFFFLMNPHPIYHVIILDRLSTATATSDVHGMARSVRVAKLVQQQLADALGYTCTDFTRKDKYTVLVGHDGIVKDKRFTPKSSSTST